MFPFPCTFLATAGLILNRKHTAVCYLAFEEVQMYRQITLHAITAAAFGWQISRDVSQISRDLAVISLGAWHFIDLTRVLIEDLVICRLRTKFQL